MSNPCYCIVKDQPTNIMVEIHPVVPRLESPAVVLSFAQALADLIKHVNPTM